jgi:hypothetical protein
MSDPSTIGLDHVGSRPLEGVHASVPSEFDWMAADRIATATSPNGFREGTASCQVSNVTVGGEIGRRCAIP